MSGSLRHRVGLYQPATTADTGGGTQLSYALIDTVWAQVRQISAGEDVVGDALVSQGRFSVRIRARTDITRGWQIAHGDTTLRVIAVTDPDGRDRWRDITAESEA